MNNRFQEIFKQLEVERSQERSTDINSNVLIIDGLNTFIRVFSAVPALNDDGEHIGGVTGFLRSVAATIRQFKPSRCIIVFDGKGGSARRKKLYPDYKANRAVKTQFNRYEEFANLQDESESMKRQFGRTIEYLHQLPVTVLSIDNVEADDIIAYIANEIYTEDKHRVTIVSTDRDFLQLVNDRINVWSPVKKILYTPSVLQEEIGIPSLNYLMYRSFIGDKSDNIPGINGVALKTMLKHFPIMQREQEVTVEGITEYINQQDKPTRIHETVRDNIHILERNHDLMQLKNVDIPGNTKLLAVDIVNQPIQRTNVYEFKRMFMRDKMYTIIKDVDTWLTAFNTLNSYSSL
jgi:DNA polymerase-1